MIDRFFFIHVMKTAGTTFAQQLRQQFPADAVYPAPGIDWESAADVDAAVAAAQQCCHPRQR